MFTRINQHGRTAALLLLICFLFCFLTGCGRNLASYIGEQTGVSLPEGVQVNSKDTHDGFLGDGDLYTVVTFPDGKSAVQFSNGLKAAGWEKQLPGRMYPWFYGGDITKNGVKYATDGYFKDMELDVPEVKHGYYFYRDRYREQYGKACSYAPYTQNFTFAVFDSDSNTLYFVEGDS